MPIDDDVTCATCEIQIHRTAILQPPSESALFTALPPLSVAQDGDGYYYAVPIVGDSAISVFKADGTFYRTYGRIGRGPNEFSGSSNVKLARAGKDDMVRVVDGPFVHTLFPRASGTARQVRTNINAFDAVVIDSALVLQAPVVVDDGTTTTLQLVTAGGSLTRGFGAANGDPSANHPFERFRRLSRAQRTGHIWSSYMNKFEMALYDLTGAERLRIVRDAPWFPPYEEYIAGELFVVPQRPRIEGVLEAPSGHLWVVISHGDSDHRPMNMADGEGRLDPYMDLNDYLDTTIEVIDQTSGSVIARRRFDVHLRLVSTPDDRPLLYTLRPLGTGELVCDIFSASLAGV